MCLIEQEILLRRIIYLSAKTGDILKIKKFVVNKLGKGFGADRCFFRDYDPISQYFLPPDPDAEYRSSEQVKSMANFCFIPEISDTFQDLLDRGTMLVIDDIDVFLEKNNLKNTLFEEGVSQFSIKSGIIQLIITFRSEIIGLFALHYTRDKIKLKDEEIQFIKTITQHTGVVIYQLKLYEKIKQKAEQERLLLKITETIRKSLDIDQTLKIVCREIGEVFNVQRVTISQYPENIIRSEYIARPDIKGLEGTVLDKHLSKFWGESLEAGLDYISFDDVETADIPDFLKEFYKSLNTKSLIGIPIKSDSEKWGGLVLAQTDGYRQWSRDEINLLTSISGQIYMAINQAELYEKEKQAAEREKLVRKIIEIIRSTLDINEIKDNIVVSIGQAFNADRCFFGEVDPIKREVNDVRHEYLSPYEDMSLIGFNPHKEAPEMGYLIGKENKDKFVSFDFEKFFEENNWQDTISAQISKKHKIKSIVVLPIIYFEKFYGSLIIQYTRENHFLSDEQIKLLETLTNQSAIAIFQAELYEKQKQATERERLLSNIITTTRTILDINELKKRIVELIGQAFNANRCYIRVYDKKTEKMYPPGFEYLSSPEIPSIFSVTVREEARTYFLNQVGTKEKYDPFVYNQEFFEEQHLEGSVFQEYFEELGIKTIVIIPMWDRKDELSLLILHYVENVPFFPEEDINFMKTVAEQVVIAINQAEFYEKEKQAKEREVLLRKIIEIVRSTLDIDEIKINIVESIGKAFDADRCFFSEFDPIKREVNDIRHEYLSPYEDMSLIGFNSDKEAPEIAELLRKEEVKELISFDYEKFFEEKNWQDTISAKISKKQKIKSIVVLSVMYLKNFYGSLILQYTREKHFLSDEQIELLRILAAQTGIALYQAQLYEKEKQTAERATLFGKIVTTFRSYLDPNEIKQSIVSQIGRAFNADRCFFVEYDENEKAMPVDKYAEYLPSIEEESIVGVDLEHYNFEYWTEPLKKQEKEVIYTDIEGPIRENNLEGTLIEEYCNRFNFKAGMGFPLFKDSKISGLFILNYSKKIENPSHDDINFLKTLVEQIDIALTQVKLYEKEKQTADRERILREVIQAIRGTLNLYEIKKIFVYEVGKYFNADRVIITEYDRLKDFFEPVDEFSEYIKSKTSVSMVGMPIEQPGFEHFMNIYRKKQTIVIPDVDEYIIKNNLGTETIELLKKINLKSGMGTTIVYGDEILGLLTLHNDEKTSFNVDDIEFFKIVANQLGIAIYQAELYEKEKQTAEREKVLREIIEAIRSTLDIEKIKREIITNIGLALNAQRVFIGEFDEDKQELLPVKDEFLSSSELKSAIGFDLEKESPELVAAAKMGLLAVEDAGKFLLENNLQDTLSARHLRDYGMKSGFSVPLVYADKFLGILGLHFTERTGAFGEGEIQFVKTLADQTSIALYQAELYEKEKQTAERERVIRSIISTTRSTLDINKIKKIFVTEIGKTLNADTGIFYDYNPTTGLFNPIDEFSLYVSSPEFNEFLGVNLEDYGYGPYFREQKGEVMCSDFEEFIKENNLSGTIQEQFIRKFNLKSTIGLQITYADKSLGVFAVNFIKKPRLITEEDVNFVKTLADQAGIALYQAELYTKEKRTAEREKILREIIETIRSTFDINQIKSSLVKELGKTYDADRCFIIELSPEGNIENVDKYSEYLSSDEIKSFIGVNLSEEKYRHWILTTLKEEVFMPDADKYVQEYNLQETPAIQHLKEYNVKSALAVPIIYGERTLGALAFHYTRETYPFSEEDRIFLRTAANQVGIAFYQASLYEKEKRTAERERLLREIIETIRSTFDIEKMKRYFVDTVGKYFNADRAYMAEISEDKVHLSLVNPVYIKSPDVQDVSGYDLETESARFFPDELRAGRDVNFSDYEVYISEHNLQNTPPAQILIELKIKSCIFIPIKHIDKMVGMIGVHYTKDYVEITLENVNFLRAIANQVGIALYQTELYEKEKRTAERESKLRNIIAITRSTISKNEIKRLFTTEVSLHFRGDRLFISEYDQSKNCFLPVEPSSEYLSSTDVKSMVGFDLTEPSVQSLANIFKQKHDLVVSDMDKFIETNNLRGTDTEEFIKEYNIASSYAFPIVYGDNLLGVFVLDYTKEKKEIKKEDIEFLRTLAIQTGIAFYQVNLYEKEKQTAERERLLREITEILRSTLDLQEIKNYLVSTIGSYFNADRCFLGELKPVDTEYLSSPEIKSVLYRNIIGEIPEFVEVLKSGKNNIVRDADEFIEKNKESLPAPVRFLKKYSVKSDYGFGISYKNIFYGGLVLHFVKNKRYLTDEELKFLELFVNQGGIAIYQARLYEKERRTAEREKILREIISTMRSTLNFDEIKAITVDQVVKILNPARAFINIYDPEKNLSLSLTEYRRSPEVKSIEEEEYRLFASLLIENLINGNEIIHYTQEELIQNLNLETTPAEEFLKEFNIHSGIGSPILYGDKFYGFFVLHFDKPYAFVEEDVDFVRTLTNQLSIAFHQAELYESIQKTAQKEALLREIISEIKISQTLDEAYNYILAKLTGIFNADRSIFLEIPHYATERAFIKYEYLENQGLHSIKNLIIPRICSEVFKNVENDRTLFIINDTLEYYKENKEAQEFLENYNIKSLIAVPLIRYNRDVKFLGIIALCYSIQRDWKEEEVELLQDITKTVVNVVWDISQLKAIDEIRNTFMLTLAHDLSVPVIGEKKALEYLNSKPENAQIKEIKPLINGLLDNNQSINDTLSKLIEIYNYELGYKKLEYGRQQAEELIRNVYKIFKDIAESKSIKVNFIIKDSVPDIIVDKQEIEKVFGIILENALEYAPDNGEVTVKIYEENKKYVAVCISDNGPGFPPEYEEFIFKRYEMIKVLGRKIGAGLSLYLAKLIVDTHNGLIKIDSKIGVGTTFCVYLPKAT